MCNVSRSSVDLYLNECLGTIDENARLKEQLSEYEREIVSSRRHSDEIDIQLQINQAKLLTSENALKTIEKEVEQMNELNARLQREKQDILK